MYLYDKSMSKGNFNCYNYHILVHVVQYYIITKGIRTMSNVRYVTKTLQHKRIITKEKGTFLYDTYTIKKMGILIVVMCQDLTMQRCLKL